MEKRWVYLSADGSDFTLNVKPTTYQQVPDGKGGIIYHKTVKPINLIFVMGKAVVDDMMAKRHDLEPEVIVSMIEGLPSYGRQFYLASAPDREPTPELVEKIKATEKIINERQIIRGPRATARN